MTATATAHETTTATCTAPSVPSQHVSHPPHPEPPRTWACNTCHLSFDNGQAQRGHMKDPWHVYNLKRRVASLPPIALQVFKDQVAVDADPVEAGPIEDDAVQEAEPDSASSRRCLFCPLEFHDQRGLEDAVEHMFVIHGLFIPDHDRISDLECFLGYLSTVVHEWHECLYCGTSRTSTPAIQSHMKDSGHCMLDFEGEPELLEFWDYGSDDEAEPENAIARSGVPFQTAEHPPAAKVAGSRWVASRKVRAKKARDNRLVLRDQPEASTEQLPAPRQSGRQLARRDEMGIQSLGPQQRHALILAEKRAQKEESAATRARDWTYARKANSQKHDQNHGPLAWAKGGLHNLLPR